LAISLSLSSSFKEKYFSHAGIVTSLEPRLLPEFLKFIKKMELGQ